MRSSAANQRMFMRIATHAANGRKSSTSLLARAGRYLGSSDRWSSAGAAEDMVSRAEPSHLARNQLGPAIHEPLMFLRK